MLKKGKLQKGDVVLTTRGTVGNVAFYSKHVPFDNIRINSGMLILRSKQELDSEFLYWTLKSNYFQKQIYTFQSGTAQPQLPISSLNHMEFYLPPYEIQKKIVKILSQIDEKIRLSREINKNLDEILDLLFKENFIDKFDNNDTDWKIKKVDAYFIRNTDLKSKCFEKFVNKHSYDFLKKSSLFGNEVIISNVGDVGSVFLCPFLDKPMTLGNNMILVKSNNNDIYLNFYLFLLFRSNYGQYLISTITAGSVQSKFNKTEFKSLELAMPDDELIIKFNELVSPIFEYKNKISVLEEEFVDFR